MEPNGQKIWDHKGQNKIYYVIIYFENFIIIPIFAKFAQIDYFAIFLDFFLEKYENYPTGKITPKRLAMNEKLKFLLVLGDHENSHFVLIVPMLVNCIFLVLDFSCL